MIVLSGSPAKGMLAVAPEDNLKAAGQVQA